MSASAGRGWLEQHVPRVYRFALRLTGDAHVAEDLTQETLLRGWRSRDRLRDEQAARVWLFRIAANLWRDDLRRRMRRPPAGSLDPELLIDPHMTRHQRDAISDQSRRVLGAMDHLPDRQREVLHLSVCEGLASGDIAAVLGISREAVKASLSKARATLRERLASTSSTPSSTGETEAVADE